MGNVYLTAPLGLARGKNCYESKSRSYVRNFMFMSLKSFKRDSRKLLCRTTWFKKDP